jgi:RNA polymerase sigma factor (sigma-70 family)
VQDRDIVAAILEGDNTGIAAAFGRYAQRLYAYCRSQLSEPADAADAVRDTFVIASAGISWLGQPDRLGAWLFALARNECQRRQRTSAPSSRLYEAAHAMDDTQTLGVGTRQAEVRAQVRAALAGLDPVDREISELHLRHGFYGADLADILGVPRSQAHTLAARARSRFEKSLGPLLLAISEREHCRELAAILDDQGGKPTRSLRRRVRRHFRRCEVCGVHKRSGLNPAVLLGRLPAVPLPDDLRRRTLGVIADKTSTAVASRGRVLGRAARFGASGFPVQVTTPSVSGRRVTVVAAVVAAAAALALLGGAMYYAAQESGHDPAPSAVSRRPPPTGPGGSTRAPAGGPSAGARGPAPAPGVDPAMHRLGPSGRSGLLGLLGSASPGPPTLGSASPGAPTSPSQASSAGRSPSPSKSPKPSSAPASSAPASSAPASSAPPLPLPSVSVSVSVSLPASAPAVSSSTTGGTSN